MVGEADRLGRITEQMRKIAQALRGEGFVIHAVYLIKLVSEDGHADWVIRVVTPRRSRDVVYKVFELRRENKIPAFDQKIRIDAVSPDHVEASRVLAYARRSGRLPVEIEGALLDGLLIDFALVADCQGVDAAAA
jgi:hypothetical protein